MWPRAHPPTAGLRAARIVAAALAAAIALTGVAPASAQSTADLQRQIDELRAQVKVLTEALAAQTRPASGSTATSPPPTEAAAATVASPPAPHPEAPAVLAAAPASSADKPWFERLRLRGYTQMRYNAVLGDEGGATPQTSRLRSVHDSGINEDGGFLLRRARLVLQGDVTDRISLYLQHDFATAVNNQSNGERREHFGQLRDAYVDVAIDRDQRFKLRFGQSKVPFGWKNLQSSSNRLTLDRSDGINSGAPGERDIGMVAYFTPERVQAIWDRLERDGQKLFGNYGAFGLALYNGQGTNRSEQNGSLMKVALATWPFELDGLGGAFRGQVLELGSSAYLNRFRPEVRTGGTSDRDFADRRIGLHAILYPQPLGFQAEWNWGRGPEYDPELGAIREKRLTGGYGQVMFDGEAIGLPDLLPFGRWQRYRGGWKALTNAPRLETDELELGIEWQAIEALELTLSYANMTRREADERRTGRAQGDLIRTQLQWSY